MEAPNLRCRACGAPIPEDAVQCPYCRSQVATVACPKCFGMVSIHARHCPHCGTAVDIREHAPSGLSCPECKEPLMLASVGGLDLNQCHRCGGVWLQQDLFEQVAADREERGHVLGALPGEASKGTLVLESIHYRPCPKCGQFMNRLNYGRISGVVLDVCKDHGLWFDKDELRKVLEFIEGGGLDKARERQLRDLEEKKRQLDEARSMPPVEWRTVDANPRPGLLDLLGALESLVERIKR